MMWDQDDKRFRDPSVQDLQGTAGPIGFLHKHTERKEEIQLWPLKCNKSKYFALFDFKVTYFVGVCFILHERGCFLLLWTCLCSCVYPYQQRSLKQQLFCLI